MTEVAEPQPPLSHAERATLLNFLFDKARPRGGRKIPNKVVAAHVAQRTGQPCSEEWISGLRKEDPGRPMIVTAEQLDAIADYFHVKPVIWVDRVQASIVMASMNVVEAALNSGVRAVALRGFAEAFSRNQDAMTVDNLNALTALMESFGAANPPPTAVDQPVAAPAAVDKRDEQRRAG